MLITNLKEDIQYISKTYGIVSVLYMLVGICMLNTCKKIIVYIFITACPQLTLV